MKHAQTIAMARGLLAEGRAADVARMLEPLLEPLREAGAPADAGQVMLRALLARVRLLRQSDAPGVLELLAPFRSSKAREQLEASARAEVALWLGWAHAWLDEAAYDNARSLYCLDEAERLFREELNPGGRCWTLIGQARAYASMDEYGLMLQTLEEATALQEKLQDVQARRWIHDLSAAAARFQGRYARAQAHVDALKEAGHQQRDPLALGTAHAYQAVLHYDLGRAPETIIEEALEAESVLTRALPRAGAPLLTALRAHVQALLRRGTWEEADAVIERALQATDEVPAEPVYFQIARARLALFRGRYDEAHRHTDHLFEALRPHQHRLLTSSLALLKGALLERQGEPARAKDWIERAYLSARETGYGRHQLRALLALADVSLAMGEAASARRYLRDAEGYGDLFSMLPIAARRFRILGRLAEMEENLEEARAYLAQSLSAYSLIGDVYRTAHVQLALVRLGRTTAPWTVRPLLDAAVHTFSQLGTPAELEEARALLHTWPSGAEAEPETQEILIGASLARAALSVELVAETWLQVMERLLPDRWIGVYCCHEGMPWTLVHAHGQPPSRLAFPDPGQAEAYVDGILWLRLRPHPGPLFFAGVTLPDPNEPAWQVAHTRLKPWLPVVTLALDHALLRAQRLEASYRLHPAPPEDVRIPLRNFVYASPAMREMAAQIHRIRASHSPVLITGESGTGKELIARAVHATSERKEAPFIAFNCSNVPHELFDSHLFGHQKGAFTGATTSHPGVIRAADGGTLFLDEVGDLPLDVQPKLLRFLQEGEVFPLGARRPLQVNVRVIAATNQDLEQRIREGRFREDLYYRLNVIPLRVPPLRQRREETPLLVRHFLDRLRPPGASLASVTNRAMEALLRYDWPGNVRQLRNEIERALVFVSSEPAPTIDLHNLSPAIVKAADEPAPVPLLPSQDQILRPDQNLEDVLAKTERALIERVLAACGGQVTASAEVLGLTRQGLYKKMKRLGIDGSRFQGRNTNSTKDGSSPVLHLN